MASPERERAHSMTPVALLLLYATCIGVNVTVTPVAALPGAPAGYAVLVAAPPGSEVVLHPAPGAPPVTATPIETSSGCVLYRAGPLALGSGAYVAIKAGDHTLVVPIATSETAHPPGGDAATATHGALAVIGERGSPVDTIDAQSETHTAPASTQVGDAEGRKLLDIAVILLAVVFLLASQGARRSSSLS